MSVTVDARLRSRLGTPASNWNVRVSRSKWLTHSAFRSTWSARAASGLTSCARGS